MSKKNKKGKRKGMYFSGPFAPGFNEKSEQTAEKLVEQKTKDEAKKKTSTHEDESKK